MSWHLTWQDPVALGLLIGAIFFARWLRKRVEPAGCEACAHKTGTAAKAAKPDAPVAPTVIGVERLRMGRARPVVNPARTAAHALPDAPGTSPSGSRPRG
ncbi:MAG: hypothetical protein U1F43_08415 [Myxococcota bacterium]